MARKSPDLNPIEHIWVAKKRILKKYRKKVLQIWDEFFQEKINSFVLSFIKKLKLVIIKNALIYHLRTQARDE